MERTKGRPLAAAAWAALALAAALLACALSPGAAWAAEGTALDSSGGTLSAGTYYLSGDVTLSTNITVASGAEVTLDLNGHTLTGTGSGSVVTVNGTFTLTDSSDEGTGVLTGGSATYGGGGVYVGGTFTMNGGTISGNASSMRGGGVYVYQSTFTMSGGAISGNTAGSYGGGVFVQGSSSSQGAFTMTGGAISGNTSSLDGGGVYAYGYSTFTATGGVLANNTAKNEGADIGAAKNAAISISGGVNSCVDYEADGQRFLVDGWYSDASGSSRYSATDSPKLVAAYTKDYAKSSGSSAVYLIAAHEKVSGTSFLGGSLRYSAGSENASDYSTDAEKGADLRLGFTYDTSSLSDDELATVTVSWVVSATRPTVDGVTSYDSDSMSATGTKKALYGTDTYKSNLVVTGISPKNYSDTVYARLFVTYTDDGTGETAVLCTSGVAARSVGDVCEGIAESYAESQAEDADSSATYASAKENAYATALCAAYYKSQNKALYENAPTSVASSDSDSTDGTGDSDSTEDSTDDSSTGEE